MWMMEVKMITSMSMLVEKKTLPDHQKKKNNPQPVLSVLWPSHSHNQSA